MPLSAGGSIPDVLDTDDTVHDSDIETPAYSPLSLNEEDQNDEVADKEGGDQVSVKLLQRELHHYQMNPSNQTYILKLLFRNPGMTSKLLAITLIRQFMHHSSAQMIKQYVPCIIFMPMQ